MALGVLLLLYPGVGILSVTRLPASLAIVWGILLVMLAFKLKGLKGTLARPATA